MERVAAAVPDPQNLTVKSYLNDQIICSAHTSEMLFNIKQFIDALPANMSYAIDVGTALQGVVLGVLISLLFSG